MLQCCSVVWECRTFPCSNPISCTKQRLSSALVLQWFRDWAREQHKLCLILFPEGTDWSNIRSRLHWPVENSVLDFFFPLLAKGSDINFTPTGSQRKEREVQWQMATHKEARTAYCTLALHDKDNFTVTYFAYKLNEDYLLFTPPPPLCLVRSLQDRQKNLIN